MNFVRQEKKRNAIKEGWFEDNLICLVFIQMKSAVSKGRLKFVCLLLATWEIYEESSEVTPECISAAFPIRLEECWIDDTRVEINGCPSQVFILRILECAMQAVVYRPLKGKGRRISRVKSRKPFNMIKQQTSSDTAWLHNFHTPHKHLCIKLFIFIDLGMGANVLPAAHPLDEFQGNLI